MKALPLRLAILDVGQGDTIVISCPASREAIVVDCVDAHGVIAYLRSQGIEKIRALVLTHLHSDHYRQAVSFLKNCDQHLGLKCERVVVTPFSEKLSRPPVPDDHSDLFPREFETLVRWMEENYECVHSIPTGRHLPVEGELACQIDFLFPYVAHLPRARALGYNNTSIVLRVRGSGSSALLTGDIESAGWELIPRRSLSVKADVLKFPHHGAWKRRDGSPADAAKIMAEVGANVVVFSVGSYQKGYHHPDTHVFDAVKKANATILCTQATGHCGLLSPDSKREATEPLIRSALEAASAPPVFCQRGTPCAGTVIIDLEDKPIVRTPNLDLHQNMVRKIFGSERMCRTL